MTVQHVVMFSGGVGSWAAAKRVAAKHGTENLTLLFADTSMEDEDLYRFIDQAAANVGGTMIRLKEGRTPWEVFFDERFLGNSKVDPCSKILKRQLSNNWRDTNLEPEHDRLYVGIDWTEEHRLTRLQKIALPWRYEAPLCDPPYLTKREMIAALEAEGIRPPRLYAMGFPHNNCGGFCVKAGQANFKLLLDTMPERYRFHEQKEREIRAYLGKDVSIMTDRRGGKKKPLTMEAFRKGIQEQGTLFDKEEWGGFGCAIDGEGV